VGSLRSLKSEAQKLKMALRKVPMTPKMVEMTENLLILLYDRIEEANDDDELNDSDLKDLGMTYASILSAFNAGETDREA
jgi:hypothetical protein